MFLIVPSEIPISVAPIVVAAVIWFVVAFMQFLIALLTVAKIIELCT